MQARRGAFPSPLLFKLAACSCCVCFTCAVLCACAVQVYNLAAQSHVKVSFETPEYTGSVDGLGERLSVSLCVSVSLLLTVVLCA